MSISSSNGVALSRRVFALCAPLILAACSPVGQQRAQAPLAAPTAPVEAQSLAAPAGGAKVALILPLTQNGAPSNVGQSLRNAAELAAAEAGGNVTLIVKDDLSSPEGARQATQAALAEGADVVLGPLYAPNVREAARAARAADKIVIGFSTDAATASRGVYLLSFLIENYVDRVVDFAVSRGKKSFAVLAPESDYGNVALAEFQDVAARRGVRVAAVERYARGDANAAIRRLSANAGQFDALFIPEQADAMTSIAGLLSSANLDAKRVQILGTGLWNDARVLALPALQGAWFAAPDTSGYNDFAGRYRARYNADPARIATLAYDATALASALARAQGPGAFTEQTMTNASGFNGVDGIFRFRADGLNERGLSVLAVGNGATSVVSPAPRAFSPGT